MKSRLPVYPCPRCVHPSFRRYGYVLVCDDCGFRSDLSCGADGFELPIGDYLDWTGDVGE